VNNRILTLSGILCIIFFVFISGCTQKETACEKPFINSGGGCCPDVNENGACDENESKPDEIKCIPPYVKSGTECCLDDNENGACDINETGKNKDIETFCLYDSRTPKDYIKCCDWLTPTNEGIKKQGFSYCNSIQKNREKECVSVFAIHKNNASVCEEKLNGTDAGECIRMIALAKEDSGLCDKITSLTKKVECITAFARTKKDTSFCDKIPNNLMKKVCVSSASGKDEGGVVEIPR